MKKLLFPLLLIGAPAFSQTVISNDYVVATADRKKIFISNDSIGQLIYQSWLDDPIYDGFKPTVVLVNDLEKYRKRVSKKNKNPQYDNRTSTKRKEQKSS
jgi:hypothetical protein